jgi:hypothetical protein
MISRFARAMTTSVAPERSGRIERGAKVHDRGGVGMLVLIDATPEGKKLLRGRR